MLGGVKLDNTLLTCDQDNCNQIAAKSRNRTLVTVARESNSSPYGGGGTPVSPALHDKERQNPFLYH